MRAMLLCAGKSTRLGTLGQAKPKPLLPVCNIPILRFGIANLVARGVREIVINLHHQGDLIRAELGDGSCLGAHIRYSQEAEILGTGGGLKKAIKLLDPNGRDEPFLSLNGKLIFDVDIEALLACYRESGDCLGTMVVQPAENAMNWGAVDVRPEGDALRVHNILGPGQHMFCGVHVTRPSVLRNLPEGEACMVRQGYLPWLLAGGLVTAYVHKQGYFAEHSTPKRYLQSNLDLMNSAALTNPPGTLTGVDPGAEVHANATIIEPVCIASGATIEAGCQIGPNVVIGSGAQIRAQSQLSDCVVWSDTEVSGLHHQSILTPQDVIEASNVDEVDR